MNTKKRKMNLEILMLISFLWVYGTAMTFAATQFNVLELAKQVVMAVLSVMIVYGISEYRDRKQISCVPKRLEIVGFLGAVVLFLVTEQRLYVHVISATLITYALVISKEAWTKRVLQLGSAIVLYVVAFHRTFRIPLRSLLSYQSYMESSMVNISSAIQNGKIWGSGYGTQMLYGGDASDWYMNALVWGQFGIIGFLILVIAFGTLTAWISRVYIQTRKKNDLTESIISLAVMIHFISAVAIFIVGMKDPIVSYLFNEKMPFFSKTVVINAGCLMELGMVYSIAVRGKEVNDK